MKNLLFLLLLSAAAAGAETPALWNPPSPPASQKLWKASLATMAFANAIDMHSSWGKYELNPLLAGSKATFGGQGALIKLGIQGGLMGVEYLITRGHPSRKLYRVLAFVNFGAAAATTAVAAHNYRVPR